MESSVPASPPSQECQPAPVPGLRCICGNDAIYFTTGSSQGYPYLQLHCPICGIIMRAPQVEGMDNRGWLLNHWKNIHEKRPTPAALRPWTHRKDLPLHTCPYCAGEAPRNAHGEEVLSTYCPHCGRPLGY